MSEDRLKAALDYLERGWAVFPIGAPTPARGKKKGSHGTPLVSWEPFRNRLPTEKEVRGWWAHWPQANLGVVTGKVSGIVVVDVDPRHKGTPKGLPPTEMVARTPGGGWHCVYAYPEGYAEIRCQVNNEESPLAVRGRDIRADGGYINVYPSTHHSGGMYEWETTGTLGKAPGFALHKDLREEEKGGDKWLTKLIDSGTKDGQRNIDTVKLAGYLASKGLPRDVGEALCSVWNRDQVSPLSASEVGATVRSAYKTDARRNPERGRTRLPAKDAQKLFATMGLNSFMAEYGDQDIQWTIENWLPAATVGFIASPPGGYKTWLTFELGTSIASGRPFLGKYPVEEKGPVLIVQQEDYNAQTASRNALIILNKYGMSAPDVGALERGILDVPAMPTDAELPLHFHADRNMRFDSPDLLDALEEAVKRIRPKLVIFDPFYQLVTTDDYMAKAAADMSRLKTLRDKYGTSFLMVHHTTKGGEGEWGRSKMWGSQFLNAFSETLWHIRRPETEAFNMIKRTFKLTGIQTPVKVSFDIDVDTCTFRATPEEITTEEAEQLLKSPSQEPGNPGKTTRSPSVSKRVLALLSSVPGGLGAEDIAEELELPVKPVVRTLTTLAGKGDIAQSALGKWSSTIPDLG